MSADPGSIRADAEKALPNLAAGDISTDPHTITAPARTGTEIELRIHTSIAPFDVAAEEWFPAAAGFAVTVIVHPVDAATGQPRYLAPGLRGLPASPGRRPLRSALPRRQQVPAVPTHRSRAHPPDRRGVPRPRAMGAAPPPPVIRDHVDRHAG
ncbi:hypothetical protein ACFWAY_25270 [Rhodococcus sp. NPDC059968]|uniref:hypothetical protein n=1 Tax=Rhodococcus sp. NPDC059968 TaxID=3347017 RepID=UPI003672F93D